MRCSLLTFTSISFVAAACAAPVTSRDASPDTASDAVVASDSASDDVVSPIDTGGDDVDTMDASDAQTDLDADDAPAGSDATDAPPGDAVDPRALERQRFACDFHAGDRVGATLGLTAADRAAIPLRHLIVYVGENRSFDHYLGRLPAMGRTDVDGTPAGYSNPRSGGGAAVVPLHANTMCIGPDVPHGWTPMHQAYNAGAMNQFFNVADSASASGQRALRYYDQTDLPFLTWVYRTYALSDRFFASVLGPTWPNRDYLYAATSDGVKNTGDRTISVRTIFDALDNANVRWRVYHAGSSRQDCIGWGNGSSHAGVFDEARLMSDLADGSLPPIAFIDGPSEHPPNSVLPAERFTRRLYQALVASPLWGTSALVLSYDEGGGFFDHVPPPTGCRPDGTLANTDFNRLGVRVPLAVISPWARPHYASHVRAETASITRLIEALHNLPALTDRDANVSALFDLFDFSAPSMMNPPAPPAAGTSTENCP